MDTSGNGVAGAAGRPRSVAGDRPVTPTGAVWSGSAP